MIKVGHKPYSSVGTEGHPDYRKGVERGITITNNPKPLAIPQVFIVGGESQATLAALQVMEAEGKLAILNQEVDDYAYECLKTDRLHEDELTESFGDILPDILLDLEDNISLDKKHKHPHWHKSHW